MFTSFLIGVALAAPLQIDRSAFSMIEVPHAEPTLATFQMLAAPVATPKANRIESLATVKPLVEKEAVRLAERFKDNTNKLRRRFVRNRLVDYFYSLPNIHGPLTEKEDDDLDAIVESVCKPYDIKDVVLPIDSGAKAERWVLLDGARAKAVGWIDPTTNMIRFNLEEQSDEFKRVYSTWKGVAK